MARTFSLQAHGADGERRMRKGREGIEKRRDGGIKADIVG